MNKLSTIATRIAISLGALASSVQAASYDYEYSYGDMDSSGLGLAFSGVSWLITCCSCIFTLVALGIWVWMLIDVLKRTEAELPDKTTWILIVILLGPLGAIIYFFAKRRELAKKK